MWRVCLFFGWTALASPVLSPAWAGEIRGRIIISHQLTKPRVSIPNYQFRGPSVSLPATDLSSGGEYGRTVVYLETAAAPPPSPVAASLVQKNQRFDPRLVIVPMGSTVSFPNADPIFHNVFSLSPAREFDLGYYPAGETREVLFDQPGIVQVYCHLHSDMNAAIVVVPTQWYSQPDASGDFAFANLPAGNYRVTVWHRAAGFFLREVKLSDRGTAELSFEIPLREAP
jgi:plastocyanin